MGRTKQMNYEKEINPNTPSSRMGRSFPPARKNPTFIVNPKSGMLCTTRQARQITYDVGESPIVYKNMDKDKVITFNKSVKARKAAHKVLSKLKYIPDFEYTQKQKASFEWANSVLREEEEFARELPAMGAWEYSDHDIQSSSDEEQPLLKKQKFEPSPTTSIRKQVDLVIDDQFVLAVIDKGNPDGSISLENWKKIELALLKDFTELLDQNPGPPPCCRDAGWYLGHIKLISCSGERSAELFKVAISCVGEVWPGAELEAIPKEDAPQRRRMRTSIPAEPSDPNDILEMIQFSNSELPTEDWRVVKVGEAKEYSRQVIISINEETYKILQQNKGEINYGFGSTFLHTCNEV